MQAQQGTCPLCGNSGRVYAAEVEAEFHDPLTGCQVDWNPCPACAAGRREALAIRVFQAKLFPPRQQIGFGRLAGWRR